MVMVPAGPFLMGCDSCGDEVNPGTDEKPQPTVTLSRFYIDRTEVSQSDYASCVAAGARAWVHDYYDPGYDQNQPATDPQGPETGTQRGPVVRPRPAGFAGSARRLGIRFSNQYIEIISFATVR